MKLGIVKKSISTTLTSIASLFLVASFSTVAFADNKEAVTGDIKVAKNTTQFIAKAPTDLGFKALDANADGKISVKEAIKDIALAEKFNATDINHDGAITAEEYALYTSKTKKPTAVN